MPVLVLGGGGHAKPVIEALRAGGLAVAGILDDARHEALLGAPWLGTMAALAGLARTGIEQAVVAIGDNALRSRLAEACRAAGLDLPPLVHPAAMISPSASVEAGAQVMARAVVGPLARIGPLALVNTGAIVEHDVAIGEAAHVAPGAVLCGGASLGARALLGAGAVVRPGARIGAAALVLPGAAVGQDVPEGARWGGVPARPLA
jgi:UDP-perosamine 4-acetyltransferase